MLEPLRQEEREETVGQQLGVSALSIRAMPSTITDVGSPTKPQQYVPRARRRSPEPSPEIPDEALPHDEENEGVITAEQAFGSTLRQREEMEAVEQVCTTYYHLDEEVDPCTDIQLPHYQRVNYEELKIEQEILEKDRRDHDVHYQSLIRQLDDHMQSVRETFNDMLTGKFRVKEKEKPKKYGTASEGLAAPPVGAPKLSFVLPEDDRRRNSSSPSA